MAMTRSDGGPTISELAAGSVFKKVYTMTKLDQLYGFLCPHIIHPSVPLKQLWGSVVLNFSRPLLSLPGFDSTLLPLITHPHSHFLCFRTPELSYTFILFTSTLSNFDVFRLSSAKSRRRWIDGVERRKRRRRDGFMI